MAIVLEHDEVVRTMTGGMASNHPTFEGSERLRPNGRPTGAFRDELRNIPDVANAVTCLISVVLPIVLVARSSVCRPLAGDFVSDTGNGRCAEPYVHFASRRGA